MLHIEYILLHHIISYSITLYYIILHHIILDSVLSRYIISYSYQIIWCHFMSYSMVSYIYGVYLCNTRLCQCHLLSFWSQLRHASATAGLIFDVCSGAPHFWTRWTLTHPHQFRLKIWYLSSPMFLIHPRKITDLQMTSPETPGLRLGRLGLRGLGLAGNHSMGTFRVATLFKSHCLVSW